MMATQPERGDRSLAGAIAQTTKVLPCKRVDEALPKASAVVGKNEMSEAFVLS